MVTLCWAAKGGSGTTVVTAILALESARPSLLVDLAGEVPTVLGLPEPDRPGVLDWLAGTGSAAQLADLTVEVTPTTTVLPSRLGGVITACSQLDAVGAGRWGELVAWLEHWEHAHDGEVFVDAGTGCPPAPLAQRCPQRWLVTRNCYLALRRGARSADEPTGVILVAEAGRALGARDVERSLGSPVVATIPLDPKIARAIDSGLLVSRAPFVARRELRRVAA